MYVCRLSVDPIALKQQHLEAWKLVKYHMEPKRCACSKPDLYVFFFWKCCLKTWPRFCLDVNLALFCLSHNSCPWVKDYNTLCSYLSGWHDCHTNTVLFSKLISLDTGSSGPDIEQWTGRRPTWHDELIDTLTHQHQRRLLLWNNEIASPARYM